MSQLNFTPPIASNNNLSDSTASLLNQSVTSDAFVDQRKKQSLYKTLLNNFINKEFTEAVNLIEPLLLGKKYSSGLSPPQNGSSSIYGGSLQGSFSSYDNLSNNTSSINNKALTIQDENQAYKIESHAQFVKLWNLYFALLNVACDENSLINNSNHHHQETASVYSSTSSSSPHFSVNSERKAYEWQEVSKRLVELIQSNELWGFVSESAYKAFYSKYQHLDSSEDQKLTGSDMIPIETVIPLISLIAKHDEPSLLASYQENNDERDYEKKRSVLLDLKNHVEHYMSVSIPIQQSVLFSDDQFSSSSPSQLPYPSVHVFQSLNSKLTHTYITRLLLPLNEYAYCREFILSMAQPEDESQQEEDFMQTQLIEQLEAHEQAHNNELAEVEAFKKQQKKLIEQRALEIKRQQEQQKQQEKNQNQLANMMMKKRNDDTESVSSSTSSSRKSKRSSSSKKSNKSSSSSKKSKKSKNSQTNKNNNSTVWSIVSSRWSTLLSPIFTKTTLYSGTTFKIISILASLIIFGTYLIRLKTGTIKNDRAIKLKKFLVNIWFKILQTFQMGTKVSYV